MILKEVFKSSNDLASLIVLHFLLKENLFLGCDRLCLLQKIVACNCYFLLVI